VVRACRRNRSRTLHVAVSADAMNDARTGAGDLASDEALKLAARARGAIARRAGARTIPAVALRRRARVRGAGIGTGGEHEHDQKAHSITLSRTPSSRPRAIPDHRDRDKMSPRPPRTTFRCSFACARGPRENS